MFTYCRMTRLQDHHVLTDGAPVSHDLLESCLLMGYCLCRWCLCVFFPEPWSDQLISSVLQFLPHGMQAWNRILTCSPAMWKLPQQCTQPRNCYRHTVECLHTNTYLIKLLLYCILFLFLSSDLFSSLMLYLNELVNGWFSCFNCCATIISQLLG